MTNRKTTRVLIVGGIEGERVNEIGLGRMVEVGLRSNGIIADWLRRDPSRDSDARLWNHASGYDVVILIHARFISAKIVSAIRLRGVKVVVLYCDAREQPEPWLVGHMRSADLFMMTSGGWMLERYAAVGRPAKAESFFPPCDPALADRLTGSPRSVAPPLWAARAHHFVGPERRETYEYLARRGDVDLIGCPRFPFIARSRRLTRIHDRLGINKPVLGDAFYRRIIAAKMVIGVSGFQNIPLCSSNRMITVLGFGTLYLCWRFPGCDDLFEDGKEVLYFSSVCELASLIDYYLAHPDEAEEIARAGQRRAHKEHNAGLLARRILEGVE